MKFKKLNIIIILLSICLLLAYVFSKDKPADIAEVFLRASPYWLICMFLCVVVYWLLDTLVLYIIARRQSGHVGFSDSLHATMIGQFFNSVTPAATGGQPMQIYYLVGRGISLGAATCSVLSKFIIYQTVMTIYTFILFISRQAFFTQQIGSIGNFALAGFLVHAGVAVFLYMIGFFKKAAFRFTHFCVRVLTRLHIVKNPESKLEYIDRELDMFYTDFHVINKDPVALLSSSLITLLQLTVYLSIPFFIYHAFGLSGNVFWGIFTSHVYVMLISSFFPLPGGSGAAEVSFLLIFTLYFPRGYINPATILWRFCTFYLNLLIGGLFVFFAKKKHEIPKDADKAAT